MIKSGFPLRFICCYVLSILFGTILFSGAAPRLFIVTVGRLCNSS